MQNVWTATRFLSCIGLLQATNLLLQLKSSPATPPRRVASSSMVQWRTFQNQTRLYTPSNGTELTLVRSISIILLSLPCSSFCVGNKTHFIPNSDVFSKLTISPRQVRHARVVTISIIPDLELVLLQRKRRADSWWRADCCQDYDFLWTRRHWKDAWRNSRPHCW